MENFIDTPGVDEKKCSEQILVSARRGSDVDRPIDARSTSRRMGKHIEKRRAHARRPRATTTRVLKKRTRAKELEILERPSRGDLEISIEIEISIDRSRLAARGRPRSTSTMR